MLTQSLETEADGKLTIVLSKELNPIQANLEMCCLKIDINVGDFAEMESDKIE